MLFMRYETEVISKINLYRKIVKQLHSQNLCLSSINNNRKV